MRVACVRPCRACPWRRDTHSRDIPGFQLELAEGLAATSPAGGLGPDYGAPLFACHESKPDDEIACAGWLAAVGNAHPNVRLLIMRGELDPAALAPGDGWPPLHDSFESMIAELREQEEDR